MTSLGDSTSGDAVVVRRLIPVRREKVFAAWLDPESLATWMCPGDVTRTTAEVDPRVGGTFRIVMGHRRGDVEHRGEYLVIEPPARLSFTWISPSTDRRPTLVIVELIARGSSTELILTHRGLAASAIEGHRSGWSDIVHKLGEVLTASA